MLKKNRVRYKSKVVAFVDKFVTVLSYTSILAAILIGIAYYIVLGVNIDPDQLMPLMYCAMGLLTIKVLLEIFASRQATT